MLKKLLCSAFVLCIVSSIGGCSSYDKHQAGQSFLDGAKDNAETNQKQAEQQHRKPDSSLLPDVLAGAGTVFLQWLTSSNKP